jgi:RNA polymerase sigma factor (sigma-70 family)
MSALLVKLAAFCEPADRDGELLTRYCRDRDEAAFAIIVKRHGSTVFGVCCRILGDTTDAEDAFQVVFMTLARRANELTQCSNLGNWLYGVAIRLSLQARRSLARRRKHERNSVKLRTEFTFDPTPQESWIDHEIASLPDKVREAVVSCLVQDRPRAEVAAELGIPEGTLASRLDSGRKRLANRLARYRVALIFTGLLIPVPRVVSETLAANIHSIVNSPEAWASLALPTWALSMKAKLAIALTVAVAMGVSLIAYRTTTEDPEVPPVEARTKKQEGPQPPEVKQVEMQNRGHPSLKSCVVTLWRPDSESGKNVFAGRIHRNGVSWFPQRNTQYAWDVELDSPHPCQLLRVLPDGTTHLLYPTNEEALPEKRSAFRYPEKQEHDGIHHELGEAGNHALLLVVQRQAAAFHRSTLPDSWKTMIGEGAYLYEPDNGIRELELLNKLTLQAPNKGIRKSVVELVQFFEKQSNVRSVFSLTFPVRR